MAGKKARMNNRERVEALLRREKPDRVPNWPFSARGFAAIHTKLSIADAYNNPKKSLEAQRKVARDFNWVCGPRIGYAAYGGWEFGGEVKWPSGQWAQAPSVIRFPVETLEEAMKIEAPKDVSKVGMVPLMKEFFDLSSKDKFDNEPFNVMFQIGGPFNTAAMICSPEKLCKWVIKKPDVAHHLVQIATDHMVDLSKYFSGLYGTKGVIAFSGEAVGTNDLISAKQFEEFVMPYFRDAHKKILAMGFKYIYSHLCGEQNQNLPFWAQIPFGDPGFVSIGHEVELAAAGKFFPKDIIVGNLEPAIIQVRTPEEVYEAAMKNIIDGMTKCPGGYIFSPGCETGPKTSAESVMAIGRAIDDVGWYD